MHLRPIEATDNARVAQIIRDVMTEYGAVGPGYSINDPEVDAMYESYQDERSLFLVLEDDHGQPVGVGGIAPLTGGDPNTCELRKMYFLPEARGKGWGRRIVERLETEAALRGFDTVYLETIAGMAEANILYKHLGYQALSGHLGHTGHSSCGLFYTKAVAARDRPN
jgi:putative acetyltransferase